MRSGNKGNVTVPISDNISVNLSVKANRPYKIYIYIT